jgi:hypothetical protein
MIRGPLGVLAVLLLVCQVMSSGGTGSVEIGHLEARMESDIERC